MFYQPQGAQADDGGGLGTRKGNAADLGTWSLGIAMENGSKVRLRVGGASMADLEAHGPGAVVVEHWQAVDLGSRLDGK